MSPPVSYHLSIFRHRTVLYRCTVLHHLTVVRHSTASGHRTVPMYWVIAPTMLSTEALYAMLAIPGCPASAAIARAVFPSLKLLAASSYCTSHCPPIRATWAIIIAIAYNNVPWSTPVKKHRHETILNLETRSSKKATKSQSALH